MIRRLYSFIFYRLLGWKADITVPEFEKCVLCTAPHTSNWDLIIGKLFYGTTKRKLHFLIKKEWFFFPVGWLFKFVGGIPVNRNRKTSLVDQMATCFASHREFHLAITPEGTRKPNSEWKKGFYFIALKAQVPIILAGMDYRTKTLVATKVVMPTENWEREMQEIKLYFKDFLGKHPKNFDLGVL